MHTPENTDRRVELGRFSRFSKLIPRRRLGLGRFPRFVSKVWQNDVPGHSSTCTSDRYRRRVRLSRLSPSAGRAGSGRAGPAPGRAGPGRAGPARPGLAGGGSETGKTDSTTVAITCECRRMTGRVVLPTFGNKSRKTTKSEPSTGDKFWIWRETAKFDAPVGVLGRVPRTGCNYDSLEETNWPCPSSGQLLETNRGKRQSPTRLRGISWGSVDVCLHSFQHNSVPTVGLTAGVIMNH